MMTAGTVAVGDAPAAPTSTTHTSSAPSTGTPAFDAILMLQNLAATPECLDTEAAQGAELLGLEDVTDDEDNADELEASLAFLSQLLTATAKHPSHDFQQGGRSHDGSQPQAQLLAAADGALLVAANEALAGGESESLELRAGDASQNLARAAEILAAGARPSGDIEKSTLVTPARDPRWASELGTRVSLMVRNGESTASLQMTPVDLGPVEVNVSVKDSQATVHFGASQAETRALLEASIPKLREMLAAQGFQLMDSSVSSGFARSQREDASPSRGSADEAETATTESRTVRSLALLDLYA